MKRFIEGEDRSQSSLLPASLDQIDSIDFASMQDEVDSRFVRYPVSPLEPSPPSLNWGGWS